MSLFGEPHHEFRDRVRAFVDLHIAPNVDDWETRKEFPRALFLELATAQLLGLSHDRRYGGQGLDFGYEIVLAEELVRSKSMGLVLSIVAQNHFFLPLLAAFGTDSQKRDFMAPAIRGEKLGAIASTEPAGGTDVVNSVQCVAEDAGDYWVLNGQKKFITNGPIADFVLVLARTKPEKTTTSLSLIIVPTELPGFHVLERLRTLGLHTSPTGWLSFDSCRVPKSLTLGKPNLGYFYAAQVFLTERLIGSACALALASLVLEETIQYLRDRFAFGQPLSRLQTIRHRVSDMATDVEMAKRFVYSVCANYRDGIVEAKQICMIKAHVPELVQQIIHNCLQLHGGYGFLEENWLTRAYRDARFLTVGGGATEAMKDLVASYLRL